MIAQFHVRRPRPVNLAKGTSFAREDPMIEAGILLLLCQLAGESIVRALNVPMPGPVLGAVFMLLLLAVRRSAPEKLGRTSHDLLANFSLLFVPAGTGIILHAARLEAEAFALIAALIGSTALTIAVASLVFVGVDRLMGGATRREQQQP
jgi:holin-like protein